MSRPGGEYMGLFCPHLEDVDAVEGRQRQSDHLGWELLSRLYPHLDVMTFSEWRSRSDRLIGRNHFPGRFASNAADESVRDAGAKATVTGLQYWTAGAGRRRELRKYLQLIEIYANLASF